MQFQGLGVHPIPEQTIMSGILALLCTLESKHSTKFI